jgi:lysozyme
MELIRGFEGCSRVPYRDSKGIPTIGIGFTRLGGQPVEMTTPEMTPEEIQRAFGEELQATAKLLQGTLRRAVSPTQAAALGSFAYNVGGKAFAGSGVLECTNRGDWAGAMEDFGHWNRSGGRVVPGLVVRRKKEAEVYGEGLELREAVPQAQASTADALNQQELDQL